jgi:hypothetical protein
VSNDGSEWSISLGNDSMFSMNIEDWLQVGEEVRVELKFYTSAGRSMPLYKKEELV